MLSYIRLLLITLVSAQQASLVPDTLMAQDGKLQINIKPTRNIQLSHARIFMAQDQAPGLEPLKFKRLASAPVCKLDNYETIQCSIQSEGQLNLQFNAQKLYQGHEHTISVEGSVQNPSSQAYLSEPLVIEFTDMDLKVESYPSKIQSLSAMSIPSLSLTPKVSMLGKENTTLKMSIIGLARQFTLSKVELEFSKRIDHYGFDFDSKLQLQKEYHQVKAAGILAWDTHYEQRGDI